MKKLSVFCFLSFIFCLLFVTACGDSHQTCNISSKCPKPVGDNATPELQKLRADISGKWKFDVFWVERLDEGMFRTGEVKDIVPLDCLIEEGQAQGEDDGDDKQNLASQHVIVPGRRLRGALRAKDRKIFKAQ